jgi:IclR family pca regulon transcriptional regulator
VSEVARLTQSSPASARRSLLTLQALGYLESDGKRFWMLPKALLVAHAYLASRPTPSLAQPLLDALSERTRESASLAMLLGDDAIIIARSTARRSLSTGLGIGSRLPAYCAALGRVLLAGLPPAEAARRVRAMPRPSLTARTVTDAGEVLALIDRCREEGYASNDGELELGRALDGRARVRPLGDGVRGDEHRGARRAHDAGRGARHLPAFAAQGERQPGAVAGGMSGRAAPAAVRRRQ